jgi:hypothetical protein
MALAAPSACVYALKHRDDSKASADCTKKAKPDSKKPPCFIPPPPEPPPIGQGEQRIGR